MARTKSISPKADLIGLIVQSMHAKIFEATEPFMDKLKMQVVDHFRNTIGSVPNNLTTRDGMVVPLSTSLAPGNRLVNHMVMNLETAPKVIKDYVELFANSRSDRDLVLQQLRMYATAFRGLRSSAEEQNSIHLIQKMYDHLPPVLAGVFLEILEKNTAKLLSEHDPKPVSDLGLPKPLIPKIEQGFTVARKYINMRLFI